MKKLAVLEPQKVFQFFEELTQIPRCSGHEKAVSDHLMRFAKERNLEAYQDELWNVIIKKPGSSGYENAPTVILQGHLDMVCEKEAHCRHDFSKDAIPLMIEGDQLKTQGTTLGADNGIAVAMAMALLDSEDDPHPPLELLATTNEEMGMDGAAAVDGQKLSGKYLLNIDAEEEGVFFVSCAGGSTLQIICPAEREARSADCTEGLQINISGLFGGHSGMEIDKQRGNAISLLARLLDALRLEVDVALASMTGGSKHNAIPREAEAQLACRKEDKEVAVKIIADLAEKMKQELRSVDPELKVECADRSPAQQVLTAQSRDTLVDFLTLVPHGVQTMSMDLPGLVESSLNVGVLEEKKEEFCITISVRSSVESQGENIVRKLELLAERTGAKALHKGSYPAWQYQADSLLREKSLTTWEKISGQKGSIKAIHAGLECGLLKKALPDTDMISFGPNLRDVHTPKEQLSISSVGRVYEFVKALLMELK